jgi:hypothetical protein
LTGAAAAASSAGVGVGLTAAGAATAASSFGSDSRYDGATVASTVGDDVCGSDSK